MRVIYRPKRVIAANFVPTPLFSVKLVVTQFEIIGFTGLLRAAAQHRQGNYPQDSSISSGGFWSLGPTATRNGMSAFRGLVVDKSKKILRRNSGLGFLLDTPGPLARQQSIPQTRIGSVFTGKHLPVNTLRNAFSKAVTRFREEAFGANVLVSF